ncbi:MULTISPECIES: GNAT family N-acetyltransferase [Exiguobacterium]|uniref:Predicted acetyltransferase, GNAT superfamily n=1 Tax=Exiguobacterium aurantiacum TaxID=33987 RepID=A0A377FR93_9BACL|nr:MULTISPECIES: GNAT family N-acetyltransferase [Exiguobacterium]STO06965.1 Predicted acetyltransferase, GNAT superfamily [Exiguobacterium aurantiacum]
MEQRIRHYDEQDFEHIQALNEAEGWTQLVACSDETRQAWRHSNVAYVIEDDGVVVAYVRGLTDTAVSLYVCELLVAASHRRFGLGEQLLTHVHSLYPTTRLEMLASASSQTYYEKLNFRPFYGYRKTIHE